MEKGRFYGKDKSITFKVDPCFYKYFNDAANRRGLSATRFAKRILQEFVNEEIRESYSEEVWDKIEDCELGGLVDRMDDATK